MKYGKLFTSAGWFFTQAFCVEQYVCIRFSRGGGKSYERSVGFQNSSGSSYNYENGPAVGSHRDYSRSMTAENWRETKSSVPPPDEERDVLRGGGARGWGMYLCMFTMESRELICYCQNMVFSISI